MKPRTRPDKHPEATIRTQEIGAELVRLRKTAGLSVREAAHITCLDQSIVTRFEKGHRVPNRVNLESLLTAYRADRPTRSHLRALLAEADELGWWQRNRTDISERLRTLINLESKAKCIVSFEPVVISGLLQTGAYGRAVMRDIAMVPEEEIEDNMATRLCRQSALEQRNPPRLMAIIDELVLHRLVGSQSISRQQLRHLVQCSRRDNITIRVVPNEPCHAVALGSFELIEQPDRRPAVAVEQSTSMLFIEDAQEIEVYRRIVNRLLTDALPENESVELVADLATRLDKATDVA